MEDTLNKREFLKTSTGMLAASLIDPTVLLRAEPAESHAVRSNWAGNVNFTAANLETPEDLSRLRAIASSPTSLKGLGTGHSFSTIADTKGDQVSLKHLQAMTFDSRSRLVTVGAGVTYGQLAPWLDARGFALANLASLPHISVVGACATGTHGSGLRNRNLSSAVRGMDLVTADGKIITISHESTGSAFNGAIVHLGALGMISSITLATEPTYNVAQTVYENLSFDTLNDHFDAIFGAGYSVSLFTDWQNNRATQVWVKRKLPAGQSSTDQGPTDFFGATPARQNLHPVRGHSAESCTQQMGVPGSWYERLPHFKMNFTPSSGAEIQSEYFVPRSEGYRAIRAVQELKDRITPHLLVSELRTIASDDLWMSQCHQRDSLAIHFTWKLEKEAVQQVLPLIEAKLAPFAPRPHWAKVFTLSPDRLQAAYPRLQDYLTLVSHYDPEGKFKNEYLQRNLYST